MKLTRSFLSALLGLTLCLGLVLPVSAADTMEVKWIDNSIRLFDGNGNIFSNGLFWGAKKDTGEDGYVNAAGEWFSLTNNEYSVSYQMSEDMRLAQKGDWSDKKYGFADEGGKLVIPLEYDEAKDFSEGLAAVRKGDWKTGKWGYIDKTGKAVIPITLDYLSVSSFSEGVAIVEKDGKYGIIDKTGKELVPPTLDYESVGGFSNGLAQVYKGDAVGLIDKTGKAVVAPQTKYRQLQPLSCGLIYATAYDQTGGLAGIGVLNAAGQEVIPPKYDQVHDFHDGLACVRVHVGEDGWRTIWKWGYIDTTGREIVPPQYDSAFDFSDGMAMVGMDNGTTYCNYGYIDTTGQLVIPIQYESADDFSEGLARVSVRDKDRNIRYIYIDKTGQTAISSDSYNASGSFSEGLARVSSDGKQGYINKTGRVVIPLQYDEVTSFSDGLAKVRVGDMVTGKFGLINKSGEIVLPVEYDLIGEFSQGMAWVKSGERFGIIKNPYWSVPVPADPSAPIAYASTQTVLVDGAAVEFEAYALRSAAGDTNYIKLRDVAQVLNGTAAQFEVGWDGAVNIETGKSYTSLGTEMSTPFSGDRAYRASATETRINGQPADLESIVLTDDDGKDYTYYKLRDLGDALGFQVDWSRETGITIETK